MSGSVINDIMSHDIPSTKPYVGMPCTELMYSDRHGATVVSVSEDGTKVRIRLDKAVRIDHNGMSECQEYSYFPDPNGWECTYTLRKNGCWIARGSRMSNRSDVSFGHRSTYHDFSF